MKRSRASREQLKRRKEEETLERLKRWPSLLGRFTKVYIFSEEHQAYWRPGGRGYCIEPSDAGVWEMKDAFESTRHAGREKMLVFRAVA